jgi:low affinity Fe/Cu permease
MSTENIPAKHPRVKIVRPITADPPQTPAHSGDVFHHVSVVISNRLGSPVAFLLAILLIVIWISSGPIFHFSDTWQLVINTTTTIVTFLMVFAIQNTQNRDAKAMQLKLDELIHGSTGARSEFVDIEDLTDTELDVLHGEFQMMHEKFEVRRSQRKS